MGSRKSAPIAAYDYGSVELVAAPIGRQITILGYVIGANAGVSVRFVGGSTQLTKAFNVAADAPFESRTKIYVAAGEALNLVVEQKSQPGGSSSSSSNEYANLVVGGHIEYEIHDAY